ncbi:TetR/AcrR family transcriptional regulator [Amnibacterium setariae]|uniref:TetR/AcrR family transcriptional regulator n=1 Tax=Amnibacterium setariae TaxID=2306585 RepID=A0A3A1U2D0_9MICO|nr:TetR/AcrR family transcriptional regulator [Amnibacterium setariae]RIX28626.1 TetR/AcrR family transcriptional regulator [Amnibacterium setariae]
MGRRAQPEIKEQLLERCTDYALAHGLPDGLDEFAAETGTSPRMLLYHFGTRDDLFRAVLAAARSRQVAMYTALLRPRDDEPYTAVLERAWASMTGPSGQPYLRIFNALRQDAEQRLWPGFRRIATTDWLGPLEQGLGSIGRAEDATLVLAVIRGLLADLEATDDAPRADDAFRRFIALLDRDVARSPTAAPGS